MLFVYMYIYKKKIERFELRDSDIYVSNADLSFDLLQIVDLAS